MTKVGLIRESKNPVLGARKYMIMRRIVQHEVLNVLHVVKQDIGLNQHGARVNLK